MKAQLIDLVNFIKNPKDEQFLDQSIKNISKYFFTYFLLDLAVSYALVYPILVLIDRFEPLITDLRLDYRINTISSVIFLMILIVPILEELLFRLILRRRGIVKRLVTERNFKYLVYFSTILFGLIHGSNFINDSVVFYIFLPLIVMSQLLGGFTIAFLRIRFSFIVSTLYHIFWNFSVTVITFLFILLEKPYVLNNQDVNLKIESDLIFNESDRVFNIESSNGRIYNVEIQEYSLNHILDSISNHKRMKEDVLIKMKLTSENGVSRKELENYLLDFVEEGL